MNIFFLSIGIIFILFFILSFLYFILPSLSPIPFFPSHKKDLPLICETLLSINKRSIIVDLGAGTGTVIFETARNAYQKKQDTQFLAVEINPLLIIILYIRRFFHPYKKNIRIVHKDMLAIDYHELKAQIDSKRSIIFYLYIGHRIIAQLKAKLDTLPGKISIVSYMYDMPDWEKNITDKKKGMHPLYTYSLSTL